MAFVAGIDEAGFGPVLGPLVVSTAAFEVPAGREGECLWELLSPAVSRKVSKRRGAVAIGDSKEIHGAHRGDGGLANLERGVLAILHTAGSRPKTLKELLAAVCPEAAGHMPQYPWYADSDLELPHAASAAELPLAANSLAVAMDRAGVALRLMRCQVLFEGEYNRFVRATRNKSTTLMDTTCRLLDVLWRRFASAGLLVHADHQGGRVNYLLPLQRAFEGCQFKVLDQSPTFSAYRLAEGPRAAEVRFLVQAEKAHLAVALASMVSKYLRELLMVLFNRFWAKHVPGIAPTAGYYTDGRRFYAQIQTAMRDLGVAEDSIYRSR